MGTLGYIAAASLIGGLLSIVCAALISFTVRAQWVTVLVSFAIGALLGAAFLEVLPHAFGNAEDLRAVSATVLAGILAFFVLEKLVLWRHFHGDEWEGHDHHTDGSDHGRSGLMILVGDSFHNFVDGVLIAAAFIESIPLGVVAAIAVIAHEIPQEVGDFLILLHSGYTKAHAFALNLLSSLAMVVGAVGGYFALQAVSGWINTLLALAGASMIYVAVADLIPSLHKRPELRATVQQVLLIGLGVATVWLVGRFTHAG
jgi:zinc and cadmium transporter